MASDNNRSGKSTSGSSTRRQMAGELTRDDVTNVYSRPTPGVMCQQGQDWSRGTACIPQKFVRLVGHRDADHRPSSPLATRVLTPNKALAPTDTPIG